MKKVVNTTENTVNLNEIDNTSNIGILWENNSKSMLLNSDEGFCVASNDFNRIGNIVNPQQKDWLSNHAFIHNADVFLFDSYKELIKWFAE